MIYMRVEYDGKFVNAHVPRNLTLDQKRTVFRLIGEAFLREEADVEFVQKIRNDCADAGLDFNEITGYRYVEGS